MTTTFEQARFDLCEFETDPFTCGELAALTRYEKAVEGVPDCFGCHTPGMFADGMSQCEAAGIFRAWSGLLNNWREATRTLQEDLTDGQPLSTAGRRYLEYELAGWKQAQEEHRAMVIEYTLGRDKYDYPFTTAATIHAAHREQANGPVQDAHPRWPAVSVVFSADTTSAAYCI
jgi:hypothetical protein